MTETDATPAPITVLLRELLGDPDDEQVRPIARRMAEIGPANAESYRRQLHRWLAGENEPKKPGLRVLAQAVGADPEPLIAALQRRPRGKRPQPTEIAELRARVTALEAVVASSPENQARLAEALRLARELDPALALGREQGSGSTTPRRTEER